MIFKLFFTRLKRPAIHCEINTKTFSAFHFSFPFFTLYELYKLFGAAMREGLQWRADVFRRHKNEKPDPIGARPNVFLVYLPFVADRWFVVLIANQRLKLSKLIYNCKKRRTKALL